MTSTRPPACVLTWAKVRERVPITRQHASRLEGRGAFPARIRLGANKVGWLEHEIDAWIASRPRGALPTAAALTRAA